MVWSRMELGAILVRLVPGNPLMGSRVMRIPKAVSTCPQFSECQPCDSLLAPSSGEGWRQLGLQWAAVTGEHFVPQTPMSAASTMEAVSRSVSTQRAAMNASATLHTSSTGIKKTVWVRLSLQAQHWPSSISLLADQPCTNSAPSPLPQRQQLVCK